MGDFTLCRLFGPLIVLGQGARVSYVCIEVDFTPLTDDDGFVLDQLTEELADDLREIGQVERVPQPTSARDSKGIPEFALGTVTVLIGVDPGRRGARSGATHEMIA